MSARQEVVRSRMKQSFFMLPDIVVDHYLKILKPAGFAVYCALRRHCDRATLSTFIGTAKLAEHTGLTQSYMRKILKQLHDLRLIHIVDTDTPKPRRTYYVEEVPLPGKQSPAPLFEQISLEEEGEYIPAGASGQGICAPLPGTDSRSAGTGSLPYKEELDSPIQNNQQDSPAPSGADRDNHPFSSLIEIIDREYSRANDGDKCPWQNKRSFKALGDLLKRYPKWSVDRWEICIVNRYLSDGYMTTRLEPWEFIPQLYKFADGPLNQYGKKLDSGGARGGRTAGSSFVERARNEIDLAEQIAPSRGGDDVG
jgi:hypothetical protein